MAFRSSRSSHQLKQNVGVGPPLIRACVLASTNGADSGAMKRSAAFHLGIQLKYSFWNLKYIHVLRVKPTFANSNAWGKTFVDPFPISINNFDFLGKSKYLSMICQE